MATAHLCLIGLPGVGKSAVAAELATRLDRDVVELDEEIEALAGRSIPMIFELDGEARFRALECEALSDALGRGPKSVISTGGGVVTTAQGRTLLADVDCVWLRADLAVLAERLLDSPVGRPLLSADLDADLQALAAERDGLYEQVADLMVDIGTASPSAIAAQIEIELT